MFNPFSYPICFSNLHRTAPSTWIGHAPFAFFLTDVLRPETIVELGTYYGTSYCAFCQAVEQLSIETKCYAVDTWRGDPQSGFFGEDVLDDLRNYHDRRYGRFSRLIQSTFDEALPHFESQSIDLLHIDGFHTYEAVKSDFEKWLPKTSERAVVLFHDINVREKDFGVWQFWKEVKPQYPNFEFIHSHGLGILAVGERCRTEFSDFLNYANENPAPTQNFFYQLGMRFEASLEVRALQQALQDRLSEEQSEQSRAERLRQEYLQEDSLRLAEAVKTERELQDKSDLLTIREREIQEKDFALCVRNQTLRKRDADVENRERSVIESEAAASRLLEEAEKAFCELAEEKSLLEKQSKKLSLENQQLFVERLTLQNMLLRVEQVGSEEVVKSLGVNLADAKATAEQQIPKLIIGIVTYNNSEKQISQLIKSVEVAVAHITELNIETEMFIIDNGRETRRPDSALPIVKFSPLGNIGFGNGMNRLMAQAFDNRQVQWYLCLNPDGVMHYRALNELLKIAKLHPQSLLEARQFPEEHLKKYDPKTLETSWASGACLLISKQIYETIGGFDPGFFMYLEDVDFSWRARAEGFKIKFVPDSLFGHSVLDRRFDEKTDRYMLLSGRYLALKWKNKNFQEWAENELVKREYYPSVRELPELPELSGKENIKPEISNFDHYFYFSPPRW